MNGPHTLQQAIIYLSDPDRAFQYALGLRWPDGIVFCPGCGSEPHSFMKKRRVWECYGCKRQFSLKVGTIMEDSARGLDKWMMAAWMIATCKNGISSYEIAWDIGVTQKSAWFSLFLWFSLRLRKWRTRLRGAEYLDHHFVKLLQSFGAFDIFELHNASL